MLCRYARAYDQSSPHSYHAHHMQTVESRFKAYAYLLEIAENRQQRRFYAARDVRIKDRHHNAGGAPSFAYLWQVGARYSL